MRFFPPLIMLLIISGCLNFGDNWVTTNPTLEQLNLAYSFTGLRLDSIQYEMIKISWFGSAPDKRIMMEIRLDKNNLNLFNELNKNTLAITNTDDPRSIKVDIFDSNDDITLIINKADF